MTVSRVAWHRETAGASHFAQTTVYNLGIASTHTYFVGNENGGVWVHNKCSDTWGNLETLAKHVKDHGRDFGTDDPEVYCKKASDFLRRSQSEDLPTRIDDEGIISVYEKKTNTFGAYNPDGTTRTFYKPGPGEAYWRGILGKSPTVLGDPLAAFR